jgi:hypothetical protein
MSLGCARKWACAVAVAGALVVGLPGRASADAIGIFSFDVDSVFGPFFTVENDSGASFTQVAIDLFSDAQGDQDLVTSLSLPDVDPGGIWQTLDDLTSDSFGSAVLSFLYAPTGTIQIPVLTALDFACDAEAGCSTTLVPPPAVLIDFVANQGGSGGDGGGGTQPVPEPPTWVLLGAALAAITVAAGRRGCVRMR